MLNRENRLTASRLFSRTVRRGRRAGTRTVVLHLDAEAGVSIPQVGFVVSKAVGNAVTRNVVQRRLRHITRERISSLPGSAVLVVRALPAAAGSSFDALEADVDHALNRLLRGGAAGRSASAASQVVTS